MNLSNGLDACRHVDTTHLRVKIYVAGERKRTCTGSGYAAAGSARLMARYVWNRAGGRSLFKENLGHHPFVFVIEKMAVKH